MTWEFNPFTNTLDFYEKHYEIVTHSTDVLLGVGDMKKIHVMDVSGGERAFWLPGATSIGTWVTLVRDGVGNLLRVWAGASDRVLNSGVGGYVECSDVHDFCSLTLIVVEAGQWMTPEFGIWSSH